MKFAYATKLHLSPTNKERLNLINRIIEEYRKAGYKLTLRQLYYQLVSRGVIPNKDSEYKKLGGVLTAGRMAGIVDWDAIEDRTRRPHQVSQWESPARILEIAAETFRLPRMKGQGTYIEVWVEKDALSEVIKQSTDEFNIPVMVNRGYSSTSAMHDAFERIVDRIIDDKESIVILYLGDHDPSGMDMVRDIRSRLEEFFIGHQRTNAIENGWSEDEADNTMNHWRHQFEEQFSIQRLGLNMDQIRKYNPPPNPAKITDPRAAGYIAEFGPTSWEVDALNPRILHTLIQDGIKEHLDDEKYQAMLAQEEKDKAKLKSFVKTLKKDGDK